MRDAILTTLAVGEKYTTLVAPCLRETVAAGNAALVVTDRPADFAGIDVEIVRYEPEMSSLFHAKRHAVRAGLARAWTVYFMDADHRVRARPMPHGDPLLPRLPVGASAHFHMQPITQIEFNYAGGLSIKDQERQLDTAAAALDLPSWRDATWWGDWLFAVTRNTEDDSGKWLLFCETWDRFARWSAAEGCSELAFGDGVALAWAAHACGWRPQRRTASFVHITSTFQHLMAGDWKEKFVQAKQNRG